MSLGLSMRGRTTESPPTAPTSQDALATLLRDVLPPQGAWSDEEYLWLTDHTSRLIEFSDGCVQTLPTPTSIHQLVLAFLFRLFDDHVMPRGGVVAFSALRLRIRPGKFREPDLLLLLSRKDPPLPEPFLAGCRLGGRGRQPG